jgi:hypothetical protein
MRKDFLIADLGKSIFFFGINAINSLSFIFQKPSKAPWLCVQLRADLSF